MKRRIFAYCLSLVFLLLTNCVGRDAKPTTGPDGSSKYFDLKGFMEAERERLARIKGFTKTVLANGASETKKLDNINLDNELKPFMESDINKPAWADKYSIDSIFNENQALAGLRYSAKEDKLKTRLLEIQFENSQVAKVFIENATKTNVASTYQALTYLPKSGYTIESKQSVPLMDQNHFKVEVSFSDN